MKRRTFIIVLSAIGLALGSWWIVNFIRDLFTNPVTKPKALSSILSDNELRSIGDNYLKVFPGEANEDALMAILLNKNARSGDISDDLNDRIREDFEKGNVVVINGWVLAVTEARQCALFALET